MASRHPYPGTEHLDNIKQLELELEFKLKFKFKFEFEFEFKFKFEFKFEFKVEFKFKFEFKFEFKVEFKFKFKFERTSDAHKQLDKSFKSFKFLSSRLFYCESGAQICWQRIKLLFVARLRLQLLF